MTIKLLIVDHHDSYTNNILKILEGDIEVFIINHDRLHSHLVIDRFDAVILSPGPGRSDNDNDFNLGNKIIKYAVEIKKPLLGICLGHQGIATALSTDSKLQPVNNIKHGHRILITLTAGRLFRGIQSNLHVVTYNSLTIKTSDNALVNSHLKITATEANDNNSIMALEHTRAPIYGLQFHPESIQSECGAQIMNNFIDICYQYKRDTLTVPRELIECSSIATVSQPTPHVQKSAFEVTQRSVDLSGDPKEVFNQSVRQSIGLGSIWLDSARVVEGVESMSYLAKPAIGISFKLSDHSLTIQTRDESSQVTINGSFWIWFDKLQKIIEILVDKPQSNRFSVGWVTALGYELGKDSLEGYDTCQTKLDTHLNRSDQHNSVDALLLFCNQVLAFNHVDKVWKQYGLKQTSSIDYDSLPLEDGMRFILDHLLTPSHSTPQPQTSQPPHQLPFKFMHPPQAYKRAIEEARRQIALGESYELCLTTRFTADAEDIDHGDCWEIYKQLRSSNPAPYAAFINIPILNLAILSSSPERFMRMDDSRVVEMKPIKGTVGRDKDDAVRDTQLADSLQQDEKERAENLMIVDLIRSDLLSFCEPASVDVPHLMCIETFEKVHQLVSTIRGRRRSNVGVVDSIKRSFPPGSMTGSPKLRSVRILERLEGTNRGFYSGCIGYIGVNGCTDLSVVIRTIVYADQGKLASHYRKSLTKVKNSALVLEVLSRTLPSLRKSGKKCLPKPAQ